MKPTIDKITTLINKGDKLYYEEQIIGSVEILESGCCFEIPTANTDWSLEIFEAIRRMCMNDSFFIIAYEDKGNKPNHIYLYYI